MTEDNKPRLKANIVLSIDSCECPFCHFEDPFPDGLVLSEAKQERRVLKFVCTKCGQSISIEITMSVFKELDYIDKQKAIKNAN